MFNLFSSRDTGDSTELTGTAFDQVQVNQERAKLAAALHTLLAGLPRSFDGQTNINRLCETIASASPHLRFVWIGFCEEKAEIVEPYAALGESAHEAESWNLPTSCFKHDDPYSQASQESVGEELNELNSLFAPWRNDMDACSVNSALAIPLRSDKASPRGLLVFYADDVSYFANIGLAPFQALAHVAEIIWQQSHLMQMLAQTTQLDTLTGLMNRRKTMHVLGKAVDHAQATDETLSVLICRINDFDKINERHGWLAADAILSGFAKEITKRLRPHDKVGRWTSIEFLFILPRTDVQHAELFGQTLQAYVLSHPIKDNENSVRLSLSVSVTPYQKDSNGLEDLVQQANHNILTVLQASAN
jgi:diguanylate cyclase (GGDEF)-like protein